MSDGLNAIAIAAVLCFVIWGANSCSRQEMAEKHEIKKLCIANPSSKVCEAK